MGLRNPGCRRAVHEQPLLAGPAVRSFRHTDEGDVPEAERFERLVNLANLAEATVNEQQVRRRNLTGLDPRVTSIQRLAQRSVVIAGSHPGDVETPVLLLERSFGTEDHAGG